MLTLSKKKIAVCVSILLIFVSVILNISLLSTKVFKGKYVGHNENESSYTIYFYDNTYTLNNKSGFFLYQSISDYEQNPTNKHLEKDCIVLLDSTGWESNTYYLYKESVFHLSYAGFGNSSIKNMNFYCFEAIFLQILYSALILVSIITLILIYKGKLFKGQPTSDIDDEKNTSKNL